MLWGVWISLTLISVNCQETPELPDIWTVVENSYDSRLTVSFPDLKPGVSMMIDELYDITEEKGVVEITDHSITTTTNYYTTSQQSFVVKGDECVVGSVLDNTAYNIWGWIYDNSESSEGAQNFLYGPSALLRIVRDYQKDVEYIGQTEIRGIQADHWLIMHRSNHSIDYFFATDQWLMPYGQTLDGITLKAPLRVVVQGKQNDPWNSDAADSVQAVYYDYTEFKPYVDPARNLKFLVRHGVDCKGRVTLDPAMTSPPDAPSTFQVFLENIVYGKEGTGDPPTVFRSWVYYDNWRKVIRVDVNPDMDESNPSKSYKSIMDYSTGIEYKIDEDGKCTMSAIGPDNFGNMIGSSIVGGVIMADPDNIFHLDETYIFSGYDETRTLKNTPRWTSTRTDIRNPETGENFKKVVVDYRFTSPDTVLEGEKEGTSMPAHLDITVYDDNNTTAVIFRMAINLLHMKTSFEIYEFNPFDVGECFDTPVDRTWLKITFKGEWNHGAEQEPEAFKRYLVNLIATGTSSSYVRFPEVQLSHDPDFVFATILILEPAPYHLEFYQLEDRKPTENDQQIQYSIVDTDICAFECLEYQKFECKSYYECTGIGRNCFVSNFENSEGAPFDVNEPCDHYTKALNRSNSVQLPNIDIELWLETQIVSGEFTIAIDYINNEGEMELGTYYGIGFQEQIMGDDMILVDAVEKDFFVAYHHGRLKNTDVQLTLKQVSYAACEADCLGQQSFRCESYSYCYDNSVCYLSTKVVSVAMSQDEVIRDNDCVITGRRHLNDYEHQEGVVYLGKPNAEANALDAERCAYLCDTATDFTCRSFDYCITDAGCFMYDEHTVDSPENMFNSSAGLCSHYIRQALVDFEKHPNQVLEGNRDRYIKDTTVTQCAQICEDEPDFGCDGFDFCVEESGNTCFLTSAHYSDSGVDISDSPTCDHYSREYYEGKDRNAYAHSKSSKYIYSSGDMAGLACGMLVSSIALTFAGVYIYNKYKK